jgi:hypothetical protein
MLRHAILAFFALSICSDALAVTLVPVPFTSISQSLAVGVDGSSVNATDPTDAIASWSLTNATGSSETQVTGGILRLSNQNAGSAGVQITGLHSLRFTVPDFGSPTTPIAFVFSLNPPSTALQDAEIARVVRY